jgi:hypothetical protein
MCTWEQFCRFAREPERRKVGIDARITIDGTAYELEPDMAGETVVLLWGLFDDELYAEFDGERFGPYHPVSGPIPLHRYRAFKRGKADERADRIRSLADQLGLPIAALAGDHVANSAATPAVRFRRARIPVSERNRGQAGHRRRSGATARKTGSTGSRLHRPGAGRHSSRLFPTQEVRRRPCELK